jgi:hypothetical protein
MYIIKNNYHLFVTKIVYYSLTMIVVTGTTWRKIIQQNLSNRSTNTYWNGSNYATLAIVRSTDDLNIIYTFNADYDLTIWNMSKNFSHINYTTDYKSYIQSSHFKLISIDKDTIVVLQFSYFGNKKSRAYYTILKIDHKTKKCTSIGKRSEEVWGFIIHDGVYIGGILYLWGCEGLDSFFQLRHCIILKEEIVVLKVINTNMKDFYYDHDNKLLTNYQYYKDKKLLTYKCLSLIKNTYSDVYNVPNLVIDNVEAILNYKYICVLKSRTKDSYYYLIYQIDLKSGKIVNWNDVRVNVIGGTKNDLLVVFIDKLYKNDKDLMTNMLKYKYKSDFFIK